MARYDKALDGPRRWIWSIFLCHRLIAIRVATNLTLGDLSVNLRRFVLKSYITATIVIT